MSAQSLISWNAPEHYHVEKTNDWYWAVGIITLALAVVCIMFGQVLTLFILPLIPGVAVFMRGYSPHACFSAVSRLQVWRCCFLP